MLVAAARKQFSQSSANSAVVDTLRGYMESKTSPKAQPKRTVQSPGIGGNPYVALSGETKTQNWVFRVWGMRYNGVEIRMDTRLESLSWDDTEPILRGTMTVRRQERTATTLLTEGDRVVIEYAPDGSSSYKKWWEMRVVRPATTYYQGQETYQLVSDLDRLARSTDDFIYIKSKKHPKGWLASEIIADICTRYKIRYVLTTTRHRFIDYKRYTASPIDVINEVVDQERILTNEKWALWFEGGILFLVPQRRNPVLAQVGPAAMEASFESFMHDRFATAITVRGAKPVAAKKKDTKGHLKTTKGKLTVQAIAVPSGSPTPPGAP